MDKANTRLALASRQRRQAPYCLESPHRKSSVVKVTAHGVRADLRGEDGEHLEAAEAVGAHVVHHRHDLRGRGGGCAHLADEEGGSGDHGRPGEDLQAARAQAAGAVVVLSLRKGEVERVLLTGLGLKYHSRFARIFLASSGISGKQ